MAGAECMTRDELRYAATVRRHDGFYLRLELGVGGVFGSRTELDRVFDEEVRLESSVSGVAQVGALMLGGTVAPGFVLGGGSWSVNAPATSYDGDVYNNNRTGSVVEVQQVNVGLTSLSIVGPFVAWYPDPVGGLHGEVAVGLALATIGGDYDARGENFASGYEGAGWGTVIGVGYDFWVGEQWNLGLIGRVRYANVGMSSDTNTVSAWAPTLGFTATYH